MQRILKNILIFVKYLISLKGWKRLFSFDSLMKIIFMYFVIIAILALIIADFPSKFLDRSGDYKRITLLANQDRMGEFQIFKRTMLGCRNLKDYQCLGIYLPETFMYSTLSRYFFTNAINLLNLVFKPEFNLLTTHIMYLVPSGYNVFYINVPYEMIIGLDKDFHKSFPMLKKADAFLDLNYSKFIWTKIVSWLGISFLQAGKTHSRNCSSGLFTCNLQRCQFVTSYCNCRR